MQLPLFPLPVCLLPGGISHLRIFEPRYQRLVTESCQSNRGFGMCMMSESGHILAMGTQAVITDFETLPDGLLGITVKGKQRFSLQQAIQEQDGLYRGEITLLPNWQPVPLQQQDRYLQTTLEDLLADYPRQQASSDNSEMNDISWLCQRWLEILPLTPDEKMPCIQAPDHQPALNLIRTLITTSPHQ